MRVSCLHTSAHEISIFESARPAGIELTHHVRSDLFYRAAGGVTPGILAETAAHLRRLAAGSDAVLLTCPILGGPDTPGHSADSLMAEVANQRAAGRHLEVMFTFPPIDARIRSLFGALDGPAAVTVSHLPGAWDLFAQGRFREHNDVVRDAVDKSGADMVALVQASMVPAAPATGRILTIAEASLSRLSDLITA